MMETEYTTSTGYKFFYGALGLGAIIFAGFLFNTHNASGSQLIYLFPLIVLIGGELIIGNQIKRKIIISDNSIKSVNIFRTKEIPFDHIKGVRIGEKVIYIESDQDNYPKITLNDYISIDDSAGLSAWLTTNFKDLNKEDFEEEKDAILHDSALGITEADRERKLSNMRKYAVAYSIGGYALFFASIILHQHINLLTFALLIYPLAGIVLMGFSQGLVKLFAKKNSAYTSLFMGLLFPSFALIIESSYAKILSYDAALWAPCLIIGFAIFTALYFTGIKKLNQGIWAQVFVAVLISGGYGYGSTVNINSVFDQSNPQTFSAKVIDQHISHGKSTSYHLTLSEWGQHQGTDNITVSESFYYQAQVGTFVKVYLKKGELNIPWYYVGL